MGKYSLFGSLIYFLITAARSRENIGIPWLKYVYVLFNWKSWKTKQKNEKYMSAHHYAKLKLLRSVAERFAKFIVKIAVKAGLLSIVLCLLVHIHARIHAGWSPQL